MDSSSSPSDHDVLIALNANVENLAKLLTSHIEANNQLNRDHESRIRQLENENQQLKGAQRSQKTQMSVVSWAGGLIGVILTIWGFIKPH